MEEAMADGLMKRGRDRERTDIRVIGQNVVSPHPHAEAKPTSYAWHPLWYHRAHSFLAAVERAMVQTDHHFDKDDTRHKRDGHHDDVSAPRRDPDRNNPDAATYDPNPSPDHHATANARWGLYSATPTMIRTWVVKMAGPGGSGDATRVMTATR
ncbi:hypothetical protein EDB83DRAFT_2318559 [Lactarius deliciosus]|nr:hypothetical protein EDB83DRAFT_2318559 [Lactarius deliciosus]